MCLSPFTFIDQVPNIITNRNGGEPKTRRMSVAKKIFSQTQPTDNTIKFLADWIIYASRQKNSQKDSTQLSANPLQSYLPRKVRTRSTSVDVTVTRDVIDRFFLDVIVPDKICFQVRLQRNLHPHPEPEDNGDDHTLTSV